MWKCVNPKGFLFVFVFDDIQRGGCFDIMSILSPSIQFSLIVT